MKQCTCMHGWGDTVQSRVRLNNIFVADVVPAHVYFCLPSAMPKQKQAQCAISGLHQECTAEGSTCTQAARGHHVNGHLDEQTP
eukprot:1158484-Pelagomonas_calceolata.AAC.16